MNQDISMNQPEAMNQPEVMSESKDIKKPKKKTNNSEMAELLKTPPKEDKPKIH